MAPSAQVGAIWRAITPRQLAAALLYGSAVFAVHALLCPELWNPALWFTVDTPFRTLASDEIGALCLLLALVIADRRTCNDPERWRPYVVAVLAACGSWAAIYLGVYWVTGVPIGFSPVHSSWEEQHSLALYGLFEWLMLNGAVTLMYLDRMRVRQSQERLHQAHIRRTSAAKRLLESRLQAMQARVEPTFLFDTLRQVRERYESEPDRACRLLDDLIAFLRAAMPQMRSSSSTVAQEFALARAFLDIAAHRSDARVSVQLLATPRVAMCPLPPMILLPLINLALVHSSADARTTRVTVACDEVSGEHLRLEIVNLGGSSVFPDESGTSALLSSVRERLSALYDDRVAFEITAGGKRPASAVLRIPLEPRGRTATRPLDVAPGTRLQAA